jgi:hypothetical protein
MSLTNRCKSSLNGSFNSLLYGEIPDGADEVRQLKTIFPELQGNYALARQWTVRKRVTSTLRPRAVVREYQMPRVPPASAGRNEPSLEPDAPLPILQRLPEPDPEFLSDFGQFDGIDGDGSFQGDVDQFLYPDMNKSY